MGAVYMAGLNKIFTFLSENRNIIITILIIAVLVISVICCFNKWTEIWHELGKNIYYLLNGK